MSKSNFVTILSCVFVVLVSVGVAQAQTSYSENFESGAGGTITDYGWENESVLPDGLNPVGAGGLNGTNVATNYGTTKVAHGVDFSGQDLVFFEYDAILGNGDNWAGLYANACCNNQGIMMGGTSSGYRVDMRENFNSPPQFGIDSVGGPAATDINHYRVEYDRSGAGAEVRFTISEVGNPSNVYATHTQTVDAGFEDGIENLTHFYLQFRPGSGSVSEIDNIVVGVPEPSTLALFGLGAMGLISFFGRRRLRK